MTDTAFSPTEFYGQVLGVSDLLVDGRIPRYTRIYSCELSGPAILVAGDHVRIDGCVLEEGGGFYFATEGELIVGGVKLDTVHILACRMRNLIFVLPESEREKFVAANPYARVLERGPD